MRIGRTLPPAAAPLTWGDLSSGLKGMLRGRREVDRLIRELMEYFDKKHCFLVSSGSAALTLILSALKEAHPERDQVLMPAFACYSVPSAIVRAGLNVVLCDIDPDTLDFDFDRLQDKLANTRLLCVISIHAYGLPSDVARLRRLIRDPAVSVVEDAAQALGGEWQGRKLGTFGDVSFFSLGRGKPLSAVEGGVILTDDDELGLSLRAKVAELPEYDAAERAILLLYAIALLVLLRPTLYWLPSGLPFLRLGETRFDPGFRIRRMTAFQAGLTRGWQEKVARFRRVRRARVLDWAGALPDTLAGSGAERNEIADLIRYPLRLDTETAADDVVRRSRRLGLGIAKSYPDAVSGIDALRERFRGEDYPGARRAARCLVTLPVHSYLVAGDRERILGVLAGCDAVKRSDAWGRSAS